MVMLMFFSVNPTVKDIFLVLVGALGKTVGSIFDYWYGSSEDREKKEKEGTKGDS